MAVHENLILEIKKQMSRRHIQVNDTWGALKSLGNFDRFVFIVLHALDLTGGRNNKLVVRHEIDTWGVSEKGFMILMQMVLLLRVLKND